MNDVASKIPAMWRVVGIQLVLSTGTLDSIQGENAGTPQSHLNSFEKVFSNWKAKPSKPYTWTTIIAVLKAPAVGQVALAEEIQAKCIEREKSRVKIDAPPTRGIPQAPPTRVIPQAPPTRFIPQGIALQWHKSCHGIWEWREGEEGRGRGRREGEEGKEGGGGGERKGKEGGGGEERKGKEEGRGRRKGKKGRGRREEEEGEEGEGGGEGERKREGEERRGRGRRKGKEGGGGERKGKEGGGGVTYYRCVLREEEWEEGERRGRMGGGGEERKQWEEGRGEEAVGGGGEERKQWEEGERRGSSGRRGRGEEAVGVATYNCLVFDYKSLIVIIIVFFLNVLCLCYLGAKPGIHGGATSGVTTLLATCLHSWSNVET